MIGVAVACAALGGFLLATGPTRVRLADRVGTYLRPPPAPEPVADDRSGSLIRRAGVDWSPQDLAARACAAIAAGAASGALLAQGDLFVTGSERSTPGLMALGGLGGALGLRMWLTTRGEGRAATLRMELPVVADAIALAVVAGDSVVAAIESVVERASGVAVDELGAVLDDYRGGQDLTVALTGAARRTVEPEAGRLYSLLANAHATGGRLADALSELSRDYRASLTRRLTTEGGRRAIATYGPILALMVPTTLLFLTYPTLVGLRSLAGGL